MPMCCCDTCALAGERGCGSATDGARGFPPMLLSCSFSHAALGSLSAPVQGGSTLALASGCEVWLGTLVSRLSPGERKAQSSLQPGICWRPLGSELALCNIAASGRGLAEAPGRILGPAPHFTCVWLGTISCWYFGAVVGDSTEPSLPRRAEHCCSSGGSCRLGLAGQAAWPKAAQALFAQRGVPVPRGAGTSAHPWQG